MVEELKISLGTAKGKIEELRIYVDFDKIKSQIAVIENLMSDPVFWSNAQNANQKMQQLKMLKSQIEPFIKSEREYKDLCGLVEIVDDDDRGSIEHLKSQIGLLFKDISSIEFKQLMSDPDDAKNVILSINAGAGGTESCDWASMLLRMYTRWAQDKGFLIQTIDYLSGEEAGIKNVTLIIKGIYAYGYLKAEEGVHRLVRISPFDSNKRRHTSFASVDVIPEIEEDIDITIDYKDLRIDVYRSTGKGGQGVNTTDSAVRITHIPSGIVVTCQDERSQLKNKATAMKILKARLYQCQKEARQKEAQEKYDSKQDISWGSQIRSYVLHPYSMIKDHRTDCETSNVNNVLDGEIDLFIESYLRWKAGNKPR